MIVVDTNIISYFYLHSNFSELAEKIFIQDSVWAAPLLWRSEFRSVLSFYIRKEILQLAEAVELFESAVDLLKGSEYEINSIQVLELSAESGCSAYDCEFISLAKDLDVPLVTQDQKILKNFPGMSLSMSQFTSSS